MVVYDMLSLHTSSAADHVASLPVRDKAILPHCTLARNDILCTHVFLHDLDRKRL